jgi:hypothetical protein
MVGVEKSLPVSWRSLYELAAGFKGKEELFTKLVQNGKVTRAMTREDVKKLVHESVRGKGDNNPPISNFFQGDALRRYLFSIRSSATS